MNLGQREGELSGKREAAEGHAQPPRWKTFWEPTVEMRFGASHVRITGSHMPVGCASICPYLFLGIFKHFSFFFLFFFQI